MSILGFIRRIFARPPRPGVEVANRMVRARYDAAGEGSEIKNIWANADALDADASNSLAVRQKLRQRSRYERTNNGHAAGIIGTQANYVIGTGPKLRMQTGNANFNRMVEARWESWCKASRFFRKLRTLDKAKTGDGESFGHFRTNPLLGDLVKLDLRTLECDQITSPVFVGDDENYVDGIRYDDYGNPVSYDVLKFHPGATWTSGRQEYETIPAKFMVHWFNEDRCGQHRGVPETTSTLNLFGTGRRYREAVVAAAETAADITVVAEMGVPTDDGPDQLRPFTSVPIDKRTMVVGPAGAKMAQMKAEQPTTTYDSFTRAMLCEEARPLNMPYNIAACDSSGYSFSGGRLDHLTYYVGVDVERQDCELCVLEATFALWFEEAQRAYGWSVPAMPAPRHHWGWPKMPQIDDAKTASARQTALGCGTTSPSRIADEDGLDDEDEIEVLAADYGVTVEEMREIRRNAIFPAKAPPPQEPSADEADEPDDGEEEEEEEEPTNGRARLPATNGYARRR
ncbi:MAG: phage portal protein [Phycisphaerae bacterium]|nr:phage portal protein [Phycisphaerae bacterium]